MNIFVGNLSTHTTEKELSVLFGTFGEVRSARIVMDNYTRRSRGFGFVEMALRENGEAAVGSLNKTMVERQSIVVHEATITDRLRDNK